MLPEWFLWLEQDNCNLCVPYLSPTEATGKKVTLITCRNRQLKVANVSKCVSQDCYSCPLLFPVSNVSSALYYLCCDAVP